ncbi:MAG: transporter [Lewinellaceae bacterium]|nr:transporter [Saprospiraceae bacterium]MCB9337482.1 transporter [Lewinellaceae bacterium]
MTYKNPFRNNKTREAEDLGFGNRITGERARLLNKDGKFNVRKEGRKSWAPYQDLVEMTWGRFFLVVVAYFVGTNGLFSLVLMPYGMECMNGAKSGPFWEEFAQGFFFSVQTFTSVGYGAISPACLSTNLIASLIALTGLMSFALATGLFFSRFSKPKSQILFSKVAIIAPYKDGLTSFQFRIANRRDNQIINLEAKITMSWVEHNRDGSKTRRFARLPLELDKVVMLPLNWTIVHPIDEESPLYGKTGKDLEKMNIEVIVLIEGFDETFNQNVHANSSYTDEEVLCNVRFKPMYFPGDDGKTILRLDAIDETTEA